MDFPRILTGVSSALPFSDSVQRFVLDRDESSRAVGRCPAGRAGFTLVELLVAMVVSIILIGALLQIFNLATASWQRGESQADAFREARGAIQLMARDLSATTGASYAQPPAGGAASATAPVVVPTLVLNRYSAYAGELGAQQTSTDSTDQQINEEVYCLTNISSPPTAAVSQSTTASIAAAHELCAVGYFCQWIPDIATNLKTAPAAYALMRQYLNGDGTFLRFKEAPPASAGSPLSFAALYTRGQVTLLPAASPAPSPSEGQSSELAAYIYDLKFRIDTNLVVSGGGDATKYDNGETSPPADHSSPQRFYSDQSPLPPALPAYIEIRFKALSENAGRRLEGNTTVTPADWVATSTQSMLANSIYKTLILPHSEQFVLRVPLINGAPPAPTPTPTPS